MKKFLKKFFGLIHDFSHWVAPDEADFVELVTLIAIAIVAFLAIQTAITSAVIYLFF